MAVFKATQNKKGSLDSGKFKATNRKSYDSIMVYDWETKNKESISTLNNYYTKINNGEFLTADDITAYQTALNDYVNSSKSLRGINKSFGGTYSEEEEKKWNDSITLMQTDYDNASKFYSSFKNEDKYKDYLAGVQRQNELKNYDLTAGATEIAELESIYNSTKNQLDSLNHELVRAIDNRDVNKVKSIRAQIEEAKNKLEQYGDIESILAEKRAYYGEAERLQSSIKLSEEAKNDADFATYSQQGASIKNPTLDDAWGGFSVGSWRPFGEDIGNIVTFSRQYADEEMAKYGDSNNSPLLTNPLYGFMTDDEVSIYNYYLAKEGKEKASEYLSAIEGDLTARQATGIVDNIGDNGLLKVVFNVAANVENYFVGMKNLIAEEDYYAPTASQLASNELSGTFDTVFGQVMYDLAGSIGYMLPSILVGNVLGGAIGTASMGLSAMGNAKAEMINLGYSKEQATAYGVLVGASEAGLQYVLGGISSLGGKASGGLIQKVLTKVDNAFARTAIKLGGNMLSEGIEESLQTILEPWFKSIVTGVDFEAPDAGEVLYSGLLGALSAGLLEGAGTIGGEVSTYKSGQLVQNVGAVDRLAKVGSTFAADSVAYKIAGKVNENTGAYTIGRLLNEVDATLTEQNKSEIVKSLIRKGMSPSDAEIHVKWLNEVVEGATITDEQALLLDSNDVLSKTFNDVIINENSTVNQRNKAYAEAIDMVNKGVVDTKVSKGSKTAETPIAETSSTTVETQAEGGNLATTEANTTTHEGNEVKVKEISSIKDGEVFVRLDNGKEVSTKEIDFNRKEDGLIYEHVANMNEETAQYFLDGFNKGNIGEGKTISLETYIRGFDEAYKNGALGMPYYSISKDGIAALLSETQRKIAYNRGRIDSVAKIEAQQKELDEKRATVSKTEKVEKKKGKVHIEDGVEVKTERQKTSIKALEVLANALGIDIHIFESTIGEDGKRSGANGWYDPTNNSIHIDLYAGQTGESTILFTAAHELTHFIREWSPKKFQVFADFLLEQYGERGVPIDDLIQKQINKAKAKRNVTLSFDAAYEEVIADACESMLTDSNALKKIAMLKAKDKGLVNQIKTFINNLVEKIKIAYDKLNPDSQEAKLVRRMGDVAKQLQTLWTDALMDAGETYQTVDKTLGDNGVMVDPNTESASLLSVRDVLDSKQQDQVAKALAERFGVTEEEARNWISAETSLASIILNPKYSQYLDYTADPNEQAIKKNSDYPQGTVDFSNICKKRRDFTDVMNRVLRKFPNHVFEATDLAKIRTIMMEENMEVACGICYVEDRRQLDSIVAQDFINSLALYREGSKTRPDGSPFNTNQLKALQLIDGDTYTPTIYELVSLEGRNSLKAKNPAMEQAWVKFNNARGMQSVRLLLNDAEYKRQILKYSPAVVSRKNDYGGLRIYSFSDMEMFHLIDIIQVITDSATVGLSIQGYTKVNEYAKAVKDTGEKLNRSLIPKGDLGYHIENGKVVLDYDTVEGIDINHPDFFDSTDNPNVGNIVIGINETQIKASMLSDFVDYIIPFHTGQSKDVLGEKGIAEWHNYEDSQSERDLATGKKSSHQINIYTEVLQAAEKEGKPITNKVEFVNKFLEVCKENGLKPRFSEFLNIGKDGEYVYTEGYHKFLVDFKMFDTKTGEYLPQKPVKPIFDNEYLTSLLKDYVKSQQEKDAKLAETIPTVIERITNEIVKPDVKYSDRDSDGNHLSKEQQEFFKDSMVRDKDGNLLVLYHGTHEKFSIFDISKTSSVNALGKGHYFTTSLEDATEHYTKAGGTVDNSNDTDAKIESMAYDLFYERGYDYEDSLEGDSEINEILDECFREAEEYYSEKNATLMSVYLNIKNPLFVKKGSEVGSILSRVFVDINNRIVDIDSSEILGSEYDGIIDTTVSETLQGVPEGTMHIVAFNSNQIKLTNNETPTDNPDIRYSDRVTDKETLEFLENQEHVTVYRAMQLIDGKLYPPMNAYTYDKNGNKVLMPPSEIGAWEQAVERPDLIDPKTGKFKLDKGKTDSGKRGTAVAAAYNPYIHTSLSMLNDQFTSAYTRSNLVVVKGVVPKSELSSGYRAEYAKDSVGETEWHSGVVSSQLPESRKVILSRWFKPVEVVDNDVVAQSIKKMLGNTGIEIPYNVVSPNLRRSLEKIGVPVGEGRGIRNLPNKNEVKYSERDPQLAEQREKINKVLASENAKLKEDNQYLKELVKLQRKQTHGTKFTKSSVQIVASKLMKYARANGNRAELVQLLNNFYEHIANGENLAWEEIAETAQPAVDWLKNHVVNQKTKLDPHAREILDNLRSKRIYLNKDQQSEAAYVYGSFYEYRKKAMGSLMIVNKDNPNGAIALESVWYELAELYPDYFDSEVTVAEMPARLLDIIDALRNFHDYSTDYEYADDMVEQDLLLQVYDSYWDVSTLHTAADSYQKQINLLKLKHHQKIAELREFHNEKHNQLKKDYQEKITRIKSEYRERNAKTTRELMNRYQESRAKATEGRHKTEMKRKIQKVVKELKKLLLSPTKDKHVKEELQRAVAEALWSINMDTVGADERVAKYNDLIAKSSDPDVIQELTDTRDRIQFQGENLKDKLDALKSAYEKIKNSKDAELSNAYQEVVLNSISNTLELVGDTPIRYMSLEQLEAVYEMYSMVLHTVRTANKMFKESKYETLVQTAEAVNSEVRLAGGEHYKRTALGSTLNKIGWTFLKPFTAFRTIGSKTLTSLYNNLRSGEDTYYVDIKEAQDFIQEQYKKHNFSKWDMKQTKEFTAKSGKTFSLTLEQMMSIFAYSRREQAKAHLLEGGIVLDDAVQVVEKNKLGLPVKYEVTTKSAFNLSEGTLLEIIDSLTDEQKAFVKEMQSYLSDTMGAKGNEISMEMYGIKLFKEAFYFPIKSSSDYMGFKPEEAGEIKLKNPSFSKETVRHANNPVVLSNFTDVWANHVNDMSMYHSFVLPLEDFTRVFNYKTRTDAMTETMSTEATIANAYGKGATQYIRNFLKSLNGGVRVQGTPADKLISLTKKGAVLASASVTIQQPSAVMRAMAYIKPKYFVKATPDSLKLVNHKKDWAEIKQYAPIAGIKEMGHFDIGLGQSTVDWIKSNKTTMEKVDDVLTAAPAYMDELTWISIWQAVKREVLDTTDLKFGTKAYLEKVGERFTEVVSLSQVYDSVFARSDLMRNPNPLAKMLTSFMAEPSTTLNMLFDSWVQAKRTGSKKPMAITSGAVVSSIVLNAMLKSIVIAMRDDDEDESYTEKYFEAFFGDLKDNLNPLTLIPLVKDVVSIFNGYDVERMDMALFSDLKNAIDAFDSESKTAYEKWSGLVGALSAFFGVPIKNIERDIRGFINTMESFFNGEKTTGAGIWNAIREGLSGKESSKTQQLYEAYLNGDQGQIKRVEGRFKDEADIEAALRKALRENDPRIREAAQAVIDGNHAERIRITKEIKAEGHFKQDTIVAAINAELTAMRRENKE